MNAQATVYAGGLPGGAWFGCRPNAPGQFSGALDGFLSAANIAEFNVIGDATVDDIAGATALGWRLRCACRLTGRRRRSVMRDGELNDGGCAGA